MSEEGGFLKAIRHMRSSTVGRLDESNIGSRAPITKEIVLNLIDGQFLTYSTITKLGSGIKTAFKADDSKR